MDDLPNAQEYQHKTNPCDPDTDDGGEPDGSEVGGGRDPLWYADDNPTSPPTGVAWPSVGSVVLKFNIGVVFNIYRGPAPRGPFTMIGTSRMDGEWVDEGLENGKQYCYVVKVGGRTPGLPSEPTCTTPKLDPHPPHGFVVIQRNGDVGAAATTVLLKLEASDNAEQEEHPPFDGRLLTAEDLRSGVTEMMISNRSDFEGASWEPYMMTKSWQVELDSENRATVFVKFRDAADNESEVFPGTVDFDLLPPPEPQKNYLPSVTK